MKGNHKFFFISFLLSFYSLSQNCNKEYLDKEHAIASNGRLSPATVSHGINLIRRELELLIDQQRNDPELRRFYQTCANKKEQTIYQYAKNSTQSSRESIDYNKAMGEYFFLKKSYNNAKKHFDKASQYTDNNFYILYRSWQAFLLFYKVDFNSKSSNYEKLESKTAFNREALTRLNTLIYHPQASSEEKIASLRTRAIIYRKSNRKEEERQDWESILKINPKHLLALQELSTYFLNTSLHNEAIGVLKKLIFSEKASKTDYENLLQSLTSTKNFRELLLYSRKAKDKFPKTTEFSSFYARALFATGRLNESELLNNKVLKNQPKNKLAVETSALILESKADLWIKDKNKYHYALDAYQQALTLFPRRSLKEKMARVLYRYRKDLNFQPKKATIIDLTQALELLNEQVNESNISEQTLALYINAAYPSNQFKKGSTACQKYFEIYQEGFSSEILKTCLKIYQESKNSLAYQKLSSKLRKKRAPASQSSKEEAQPLK